MQILSVSIWTASVQPNFVSTNLYAPDYACAKLSMLQYADHYAHAPSVCTERHLQRQKSKFTLERPMQISVTTLHEAVSVVLWHIKYFHDKQLYISVIVTAPFHLR